MKKFKILAGILIAVCILSFAGVKTDFFGLIPGNDTATTVSNYTSGIVRENEILHNTNSITETTPAPTADIGNTAETPNVTVYRTKSGKCYHSQGCTYLKSSIEVNLNDAKRIGLKPCSKCNPPI